ncbi:MAG: transglycosylase domain-containing protein [Comamonadaceae bacterium]|nr:transglycosylase domain-containing protein [Comamonadaceae bacterium]
MRLTLWLEQEMRRRYGSQEQAKREIFARYASFIYLGNGRYGYAAASEYYFGRASVELHGRRRRATPRCWRRSASRRGTTPRRPATRGRRSRRNQILALMARNGLHPRGRRRRAARASRSASLARSPIKTDAPAAIEHVLDELARHGGAASASRTCSRAGSSVRSTIDARVQTIVNEALEHGLAQLREAASQGTGADPGLGGRAGQRGRGHPGRGGRAAGLQGSRRALLRLQPRHRPRCASRARR